MGTTGSRTSVLAYCVAVMALVMTGIWLAVGTGSGEVSAAANTGGGGVTFPGTGTGGIPDNTPGGLNVTFNVTGLSAPITDVEVAFSATHTWVGDLNAVLIAPDGTSHDLFIRTGSATGTGLGDTSDLGGAYSFNDAATGNWWSEASLRGATEPLSPGAYRTSQVGTGDLTLMTPAFSAVAPNGTWTLRVSDLAGGDLGAISEAALTLTGSVAPTTTAFVDFDGDGESDYAHGRSNVAVLRGEPSHFSAGSYRERLQMMKDRESGSEVPTEAATGVPSPGSTLDWYIANSAGGPTVTGFGEAATDFVVPQDFDGDGKADIAVWRGFGPSGPGGGYFFIMNSGTMTLDTVDFGIQGDDPTVAGDYDGDGKADPAVYRCPATAGQCFYYYKGSAGGGEITFVPWGFGTNVTLFPAIGDFDGDGKYDFNIQRTNPSQAGQGQFVLLRSGDLGVEYINWGLDTDLVIPGDYDGDGMHDIAIGRNVAGARQWWILERDGGTQVANWGLATDTVTPGDYDGDGSTDIAVWRPNELDPDANFFWVLRSSDLALEAFEWGLFGDYPVANFQVH